MGIPVWADRVHGGRAGPDGTRVSLSKIRRGVCKKKLLNWLRVSRSPEEARELYGKASEQLRLQQEHARKVVASAERQGLPSQVIDKLAWQEGAGKKERQTKSLNEARC